MYVNIDHVRWQIRSAMKALMRFVLGIVVKLNAVLRMLAFTFTRKLPVLRGRPPPPPQTLGIVLTDNRKSFSEHELQAIARLVTWAVANNFSLLTLFSPYDLFSLETIEGSISWAGVEDDVIVWNGWDAPRVWVDNIKEGHKTKLGVALLGPIDAERPLAMLGASSDTISGPSLTSLVHALEAPKELKRVIGTVSGPVATMDPDIIMIFGGVSSLSGYPSWTTRSSEIYSMGTLAAITNAKLSASLERYMRTKKRIGK